MEGNLQATILDAEIIGIKFGLASYKEICTASISECPISHSSQLTNPFLGLPLEFGKCESCGTSEPGQCEGHFGYIELPVPIYHPSHISELKRLLSLICLSCLKLKKIKVRGNNPGIAERVLSCCDEASQISIREHTTADGVCSLQLKLPAKSKPKVDQWNFLEKYGFRYGFGHTRTLLPLEVVEILKKMAKETKRKLTGKGYFPQEGYIIRYLAVPPNCLSVPDVSDGVNVMSSDLSISMLRKVLKQVEIIKSSRSGTPTFEAHEVEASDLQLAVEQYLQLRGTSRAAHDVKNARFGMNKELSDSSTKAWLEKMRTLFIRKGSGFSSRSVITGDAYKRVNEIGIPYEIAQRITFEEKVSVHNISYLQELVDKKLCLTYRDGSSTYSLREGSKGHTLLQTGQVVHRRILDGDIVFINRPPTTHKHSLQALSVYVHDDHTVKINPLICGPLSADFDGDCIHLFYPQSLSAKAEVLELFSVEKQLLSSHSGNLNLQLTTDSLLSLKMLFKEYFLDKAAIQQLAMYVSASLPVPAIFGGQHFGPYWTVLQILQTALPAQLNCFGERYLISESDVIQLDFSRDVMQSLINELVTTIFFEKGPDVVLAFFNALQPLLMENIFSYGFSFGLDDFFTSRSARESITENFKIISPVLANLRSTYNELVELQLESHIRRVKVPIANFILRSSALGDLIDSKSDSALTKVLQQVGYLGVQISNRGKFYTKTLYEDIASHFEKNYPHNIVDYPSAQYGLIRSCFFDGLDPYEEIVHSISTREVMVRSSRGLSEPGTLFKNLMAILRDVVICYDGTVRNVCSNSIIQFEYGANTGSLFSAGEPVGVLAATAMSNPAYKAVLDSSPSSNSSWDLMKEILLCKAGFKNDLIDRRVILYLNNCGCGRKYCQEKAACVVEKHLRKISLKDISDCFMIEFKEQETLSHSSNIDAGFIGHVHLKKTKLTELGLSMQVILEKCEENITSFRKKKKKPLADVFKGTTLSVSDYCLFQHSSEDESSGSPCLTFCWQNSYSRLEKILDTPVDMIYPVLLETIIKGDHRISTANIIWVSPNTTTTIRNPSRNLEGELALDIVLEKSAVKQSADAWRIVLDCCLPILHLIDTTRSIPYAIKQVQQLLGISCAFDQAVQRLSTSVAMVAKGVLKEHLLLLGNSMTYAGNLVGFNSGGYKAITRSLDIQVPFTEATLFTPRKCFERAAEKCHVDTLSSIVASCAWGKNVAVGTGSRFDVLWNSDVASLNKEGKTDVYGFLSMVRGDGEEPATACLGEEVDDLMEDGFDWSLSPERDGNKPVFEDAAEFENCLDSGGNWDRDIGGAKENAWQTNGQEENAIPAWGSKEENDRDENPGPNTWSGWDAKKADTTNDKKAGSAWSGWGSEKADTANDKNDFATSSWDSGSTWSRKAQESDNVNTPGTKEKNGSARSSWATDAGWGRKAETSKEEIESARSSWNADATQSASWSGEREEVAKKDTFSSFSQEESASLGGWNTGRKAETTKKEIVSARSNWNADATQSAPWSGWEREMGMKKVTFSSIRQEESASLGGWSTGTKAETMKEEIVSAQSTWSADATKSAPWSGWEREKAAKKDAFSPIEEAASFGDWNTGAVSRDGSDSTAKDWSMQHVEPTVRNSPWDRPKSPEVADGWGSKELDVAQSSQVEPTDGNSPWGKPKSPWPRRGEKRWPQERQGDQKKRLDGSRGWSSGSGDWKSKRGHVGDSNFNAMFTVTRQRLDLFTSDEQDILNDIEPLMRSIRRIMHQQPGFNDGDPLSAEDQTFILDNVLNHHPSKEEKIGAGIDHITINESVDHPGSRCLFVVSTDGTKTDFSYRKCLENYVRGKYPDLAEDFMGKYFSRTRNRPQTPALVGTPAPEGTPAREGTPAPVGTPALVETPGQWT